ncbi:hypothetical protein HYE67_000305 [Fusarium culmorum]|uniref:Uncharacterized protein n=1 Tax=Fusarium culmorum TaxID=5516 RepID=A0A7S8HRP9_FUSCU|nr:hypothetical protein HYE67_000305 [Fusarium culmorum]
MSSISERDEWILSRTASELEILRDEDDLIHLDEAIAFCNYLNGEITAMAAAQNITVMLRPEMEQCEYKPDDTERIMFFIISYLWQFDDDDDYDKILDLLVALQNLPSVPGIPWWRLPLFREVWDEFYHLNWSLCKEISFFKKVGTLEAKMYLRGLYPVDSNWAYRAINVICLQDAELEFVLHEIHPWLDLAGPTLVKNMEPAQVKCFDRAVKGRREKTYSIEATLYEHWEHWKKEFLQVSCDEEFFPRESRQMAWKCYEIMKGLVVAQPDPPTDT